MASTVRVGLQIEALSPLTFGARRGTTGNFVDTLEYVPGTALRGAVAARYLREFGDASDEQFQEIFLRGGVLFANLYPVSEADQSIPYVLPATAYACKAHKEAHGVSDILIRASALRMDEERSDQTLLDEITKCHRCRQTAHQLRGFYEKRMGNPTEYGKVEVNKRHLAHVGINRKTQASERGFFYTRQVINEAKRKREENGSGFVPQTFSGELIVSNALAEFLTTGLLAEGTVLRVGESRTRGLGKVQVSRATQVEAETESAIRARLTEFNGQFSRQSRASSAGAYVALTLQSDAILTDAFMRPKLSIDAHDVRRAIGDDLDANLITIDSMTLVYSNAATRLVQSWNMASGYPKADDLAISAGGVFLFQIPDSLWSVPSELEGADADKLARLLKRLQELGLGKRRSEGFGRVKVCDSFHWEVPELWQAT
jgi:CRISPR-associated protein Csx10